MSLHTPVKAFVGAVVVFLLAGCTTVSETGRSQFMLMSPHSEMQLGFSEFSKMKQKVPISHDTQTQALIERVGRRIAAVANLPNAQWEFVLFESKEPNAFCLPGGKVGVYTGILPITKDEAGLATVMGHEVAHAVARHGGERVSAALGLQMIGTMVNSAARESRYAALIQQGYGLGSQLGVALPHNRKQESEADHIGLLYMARAGYNPDAAVGFWQRFAQYNREHGSATPWFLRTHPLDEKRIADLQKAMPEAKAQFKPQ